MILITHSSNNDNSSNNNWRSILLVSRSEVMINRDRWGHSYLTVRGEIFGFVKDGLSFPVLSQIKPDRAAALRSDYNTI